MTLIAIVFHSGYGHTARLAAAVAEGASEVDGARVQSIAINQDGEIADAEWAALAEADAIIFGSPTYMGNVSWQFKRFADASSKAWAAQTFRDKIAAGFTNSGSLNGDKHATLAAFITLAMQHAMVWVGTGMMPANRVTSARTDLNYLGAFSGMMAQSPVDAAPDFGPPPGDLATARQFGARVAGAALRWAGA